MPSSDFAERLENIAPGAFPDGLRPAQAHVLDRFAEAHTGTSDLGIELPTGEGKTLIGLLIADWALDEGMSVAYLTGTRQLADQVMNQARALPELVTHRFSGGNYPGAALDDYHQAQAAGIMNYWVYFNSSPRVEPADLVIFDAHLAEQPMAGMFTLRVPRGPSGGRALYETLCDLILQHAPDTYPTLRALRDGAAPPGSPPELVAFNDWALVTDSAADAIGDSDFLGQSFDARVVWRTLTPALTRCGVLVGAAGIEIRPYHPPTQTVAGYARATHRMYLSATLGRPGDLQRRLGTHPIATIDTPAELCTATTGRRTFLLNPSSSRALSDEVIDFALEQIGAAAADGPGRAAWLCASNSEADEVETLLCDQGMSVFRLRAGDDGPFEQWQAAPRAQLVTAGRFDGLDLPDDTCRLVVLPSVPAASTEFERFAVAYLGDASYMRHRVGQRVTQALGRANRTENDSALYLGLDPGFAATLAERAVRSSIGQNVNLAIRLALERHGQGWKPVKEAAHEFWATYRQPSGSGHPPATNPSRRRPGRSGPGRTQPLEDIADSADDEVAAITRLWLGDHAGAAVHAASAADKLTAAGEPEHSAFWRYVQAHILYDSGRSLDLPAARRAVEDAVAAAPRTAWFVRLARTAETLAGRQIDPTAHDALFLSWDEWLREGGGRLPARIAEARGFLTGTHDQRAQALEVLARLCGAVGDRPTGQSATDARWVWATPRKGQRRVWEVKTSTNPLPREDVNQLLGQVREEQDRNPRASVVGCLLVACDAVTDGAARAARNELALVHLDAAVALFDLTAELFTAYRTAFGTGTTQERGAARAATEPRLPVSDWLTRLLSPTNGNILRAQQVRSELQASRDP